MTDSRRDPSIRIRAHAKLNLFLRVLRLRPDGFHDIESIFHGIDLADTLELEPAPAGTIEVEMEMAEGARGRAPVPADNLVHAAAEALRSQRTDLGARVSVRKDIPVGSGLGGGSADAAGVLRALNEMWALGYDDGRLARVAAAIGSDVPYLLHGGSALVEGRGERLRPLTCARPLSFVLGLSFEPLSTRAVYEAWDEVGSTTSSSPGALARALETGDVAGLAAALHNDLESPAFSMRPELPERKQVLLDAGALGAGMSGSGPTLFGLGSDADHCADIAARVRAAFDRVVVCASAPASVERLG